MEVGCEAGWRMRRRRQRGSSNRANDGGGDRCSREELHWRVLHEDLLVEGHHKRDTREPAGRRGRCTRRRELHMGGGGLKISHPASATIVV